MKSNEIDGSSNFGNIEAKLPGHVIVLFSSFLKIQFMPILEAFFHF